jgi:hypothetical protein
VLSTDKLVSGEHTASIIRASEFSKLLSNISQYLPDHMVAHPIFKVLFSSEYILAFSAAFAGTELGWLVNL